MNNYLEQLLSAFWLRPETALWRCFDCLYMEKYGHLKGVSADLGCGDGVMSYIMAGGKLKGFDVFSDVTQLQEYNEGSDIFDCVPKQELTLDNSALRYEFNWGLDQKFGMVAKANRFKDFYKNTRVHDLNKQLDTELAPLDSIFSNIMYWLDDPVAVLSGWCEVLVAGGQIMLFVPTERFKEKAWLYYQAPHNGARKYLNYFDRGYGALIQHCYSYERWVEQFEKAGLGVVRHKPYLTDPVSELWNIGTRPIAPLLINMAGKLSPEDLVSIKAEWVDYFQKFFEPIIDGEFDRSISESEAAFHFFVLEKK